MTTRRLPTGTVTFLFTDIDGSTRLLHELGDGYAEDMSEHRRVLRQAFAVHAGIEVDTQGDAFFVAFTPASAISACGARIRGRTTSGNVRSQPRGPSSATPRTTEPGWRARHSRSRRRRHGRRRS